MVDCIIQARMGSTRFPKKILQNINSTKKVLEFLIDQLKYSKKIDKIIIATTILEEDDVIEELCEKIQIKCFRGDAKNVLDRYYQCAKAFVINEIMRITSDCPLIDPRLIDQAVEKFENKDYDYVENSQGDFPHGLDFQIFTFSTLQIAFKNASLYSEKEHVIPYIINNSNKFKIFKMKNEKNFSKYRITIDWKEDL